MTHYTNTKTILEQTAAAAIHNGALTLTVPALHIPSPSDAVYAIDELIVWLDDVRSYIDKNFSPTPVLTKPLAFDASTIVEVKAAALRSMAVTEVRAITAMGLIFVRNAADIRWTPEEPFGAVRAGGEWIPLTVRGLETWAVEEGLNWRRDDGTVVLWLESSAGGGGGGALGDVLSTDDEILIDQAMHYLTAMRAAEMDDLSIHTLLTVGAFLMSPHNQSLQRAAVEAADRFFNSFVPGGSGGGGVPEELPYLQAKTLRQAGILSVADMQYADQQIEDHLNDGWTIVNVTYLDAANVRFVLLQREIMVGGGGDPGGQHKPLHSMTAEEARTYAHGVWKQITGMIEELNLIPGVSASGSFSAVAGDADDEEMKTVIAVDDIEDGVTYAVDSISDLFDTLDDLLTGWEKFEDGTKFTVYIDEIPLSEWEELESYVEDEDGAA